MLFDYKVSTNGNPMKNNLRIFYKSSSAGYVLYYYKSKAGWKTILSACLTGRCLTNFWERLSKGNVMLFIAIFLSNKENFLLLNTKEIPKLIN